VHCSRPRLLRRGIDAGSDHDLSRGWRATTTRVLPAVESRVKMALFAGCRKPRKNGAGHDLTWRCRRAGDSLQRTRDLKSRMRRTSGSVGGRGERSPWSTRPLLRSHSQLELRGESRHLLDVPRGLPAIVKARLRDILPLVQNLVESTTTLSNLGRLPAWNDSRNSKFLKML